MNRKQYIISEILNSISHGLGVVLGLVFLVMMIRHSNSINATVSASIYGASLIMLFLFSTIYHSVINPKVKGVLRVFDHSAIYIFIAGSYMPLVFKVLTGWQRILFLVLIWTLCLGGVIFKIVTVGKYEKYNNISLLIYILMGWLIMVMIKKIILNFPIGFFIYLLLGGLSYTGGTYFFKKKTMFLSHFIWHIFVLAGAILQFVAFYKYIYLI